jgi:hypothetical protein
LKHFASTRFWRLYEALPADVRAVADKNYELLRANPRHPSLHLKRIDDLWSVRAGIDYRTLGIEVPEGIMWVWIGTHGEYDKIIR